MKFLGPFESGWLSVKGFFLRIWEIPVGERSFGISRGFVLSPRRVQTGLSPKKIAVQMGDKN